MQKALQLKDKLATVYRLTLLLLQVKVYLSVSIVKYFAMNMEVGGLKQILDRFDSLDKKLDD